MQFYVQMRWNYEGRITLDELWKIEAQEIDHAQETVNNGFCIAIWKVAGQKRVIAIIETDSADEIDRSIFSALPMRDYLEIEVIWALRDYTSFGEDVKAGFKV